MRLVPTEVNEALNKAGISSANFGLIFDKMLRYGTNKRVIEPVDKQNKKSLIDNYSRNQGTVKKILNQRHLQQSKYCSKMEQTGWKPLIFHATLDTTFVSGLGATHPTETGLILDHLSGLPYIPAASQKGALRFAHLLGTLLDEQGNPLSEEQLEKLENISEKDEKLCWKDNAESKTLFGSPDDKQPLAGQLVILDAYPLQPPKLIEEILNPHFNDYYGGKRGPTEDQMPVPIKFLAVKRGVEFVFRSLLLPSRIKAEEKDIDKLLEITRKSLKRMLEEEGLGAKTSLGFGLFKIIGDTEPEDVRELVEEKAKRDEELKHPWKQELRVIQADKIVDWGNLKSKLLSSDKIKNYRKSTELGEEVKKVALRVREHYPAKWSAERNKEVKEWLVASGVIWESQNIETPEISGKVEDELTARIGTMIDWGAYLQESVDIKQLTLSSAHALERKFKEWGCNKRSAKKKKIKAWKELQSVLEKMNNQTKPE